MMAMRAHVSRHTSTHAAAIVALAIVVDSGCLASFGGSATGEERARVLASAHHNGHRFENPRPTRVLRSGEAPRLWGAPPDAVPACPLPVADAADVRAVWATTPASGLRVTWLGHSALVIELDGAVIVTDPAFSERCSPVDFAGPQRFHPPVVDVSSLPAIDAVVISHDHYDHLDMATMQALALAHPAARFLVPLGVKAHLVAWGIAEARVRSFDWHERTTVPADGGTLTITATPSQHFSGRQLLDQNATLWTSWVMAGPRHRVFFSGDTGLTPQFADIGEAYGPFDVAFLEVGAYHPSWGDIHLGPDNALRAFSLLRARRLWPIHWGTFNLGLHAWHEPIERTYSLAEARGVDLVVPALGVAVEPTRDPPGLPWWRTFTCPATPTAQR